MKFSLKHGDTKNNFSIKLSNNKGTIDLTGCTVKIIISDTVILLDDPVIIKDPVKGLIEFSFGNSNLAPGEYRGEFEITYPDSKVEIVPASNSLIFEILPSLRDNPNGGVGTPTGDIDGGSF